MSKHIGILTSGGDCAGLNAAIRAVVHAADELGWTVTGIEDGTRGLLDGVRAKRLTKADWNTDLLQKGGTALGSTNKGDPFSYPMPDGTRKDRSGEILDNMKSLGIEALIGIGGDGSMDILSRLMAKADIGFVGIPKTIDNDVAKTEVSIGFDTAVMVATEALDRLQPTGASHDRIMVLEVMGRDAGHIALISGIAGGADIILIPEIPYEIEIVCEHIREMRRNGRSSALIVVSEALRTAGGQAMQTLHADGQLRYGGVGKYIEQEIMQRTGYEARMTSLGHTQRGAAPTHRDRMIATSFGVHAVKLVQAGKFGRMVAWHDRRVVDVSIADVVAAGAQSVDPNGTMVATARSMGICLGDK